MKHAVAPGSDRALAAYWVLAAASAGAAAGLPWAWLLAGLLPAAVFAAGGALLGWAHWRSPGLSARWWSGGAVAAMSGGVLGVTLACVPWSGWPQGDLFGCFFRPRPDLYAPPAPFVLALGGCVQVTFGFVAFGLVGVCVQNWARRWRSALTYADCAALVWAGAASVCLGAAVAWTVANEWYVPRSPHFFRQFSDPDLGPIAIAGYVLAFAGFAVGLRKARARTRELLALRGGCHDGLVLDRGERPNESSVPWIWGDALGRLEPQVEPDRWSAVTVASTLGGDYRSKPTIVGWLLEDGETELAVLRRREQRLAWGLAMASLFCSLQVVRSIEIRAKQHEFVPFLCDACHEAPSSSSCPSHYRL